MIVSANNISIPPIAPTVNVQTEQVAKDNKGRPAVEQAHHMVKSQSEKKLNRDEKRRRQSAWDPADHPEYETEYETQTEQSVAEKLLNQLFDLLSIGSYANKQGTQYTIRFRLPKRILDAAVHNQTMARRRTVIRYHYGHLSMPHTPSDTLAVL